MKPIIPLAKIVTWQCQHGSEREGYVKPMASCAERKSAACQWVKKENSDDRTND